MQVAELTIAEAHRRIEKGELTASALVEGTTAACNGSAAAESLPPTMEVRTPAGRVCRRGTAVTGVTDHRKEPR